MSQVYEWGCFYYFQEGINFVSYTIFCHCSYNEWNFSKKTSHVYLKFHPSVLNIRNKTPLISCVNLLFLIKIFRKYKKSLNLRKILVCQSKFLYFWKFNSWIVKFLIQCIWYKGMCKSSQSQHVLKGILCKLRTN